MRLWAPPAGAQSKPAREAMEAISDAGATPDARAAIRWRARLTEALGIWLVTRLALALFTYFATILSLQGYNAQNRVFDLSTLLASWQRYDANWYLFIAQHGYAAQGTYAARDVTAFFPLYPALIWLVAHVTPSPLVAALLISNLASYGAILGVGLLAAQEYGESASAPAMRALLAYPLAFFLAAPYTEALFLALAAFALVAARRHWWPVAALAALLAALTRPTGVALFLPLVWEAARWLTTPEAPSGRLGRSWRALGARLATARASLGWRGLGLAALVAGAVPLGLAVYAVYCWARFGDPISFTHAQAHWQHTALPPWLTLRLIGGSLARPTPWTFWQARTLVDVAPVLLFAVLTLLAARRLPVAYTLYTLGLLALCALTPDTLRADPLPSAGRYLCAALPLFALLGAAMRDRPWLDMLLVYGGALLQAVCAIFFLSGGWLV